MPNFVVTDMRMIDPPPHLVKTLARAGLEVEPATQVEAYAMVPHDPESIRKVEQDFEDLSIKANAAARNLRTLKSQRAELDKKIAEAERLSTSLETSFRETRQVLSAIRNANQQVETQGPPRLNTGFVGKFRPIQKAEAALITKPKNKGGRPRKHPISR